MTKSNKQRAIESLVDRGPGGNLLACWTAMGTQTWTAYDGKPRTGAIAVRVCQERDGWRVDHREAVAGAWMPWEPVVSTVFATKAEAEAALSAWVGGAS